MATPIVPLFRLDIGYSFGNINHVLQMRCDAVVASGVYSLLHIDLIQSKTLAQMATLLDSLVLPLYHNTMSINQLVLYQRSGTVYNQVDSASDGNTGSAAGANQAASYSTYAFKDTDFKTVKVVLLENRNTPPLHVPYATLGGDDKTFVDALLDTTPTSNTLGGYFRSRGGNTLRRFTYLTTSLSREIRRARNLV